MLKQILIYLLCTILIVVFSQQVGALIFQINALYDAMTAFLSSIFSASDLGRFIRSILILTVLPLILVGTPAGLYRWIKKKDMPYFMEAVWTLWLIITLSHLLV